MYGKMQESGLIEIIPLICTSAIWGQRPVLSHPEGSGCTVEVGFHGLWFDGCNIVCLLIWQVTFSVHSA